MYALRKSYRMQCREESPVFKLSQLCVGVQSAWNRSSLVSSIIFHIYCKMSRPQANFNYHRPAKSFRTTSRWLYSSALPLASGVGHRIMKLEWTLKNSDWAMFIFITDRRLLFSHLSFLFSGCSRFFSYYGFCSLVIKFILRYFLFCFFVTLNLISLFSYCSSFFFRVHSHSSTLCPMLDQHGLNECYIRCSFHTKMVEDDNE